MVNRCAGCKLFVPLFFFALLFVSSAFSQEVKVTAEMNESDLRPEQPIKGTITVTHLVQDGVDEKSFLYEEGPLDVEFIRSVRISERSDLTVSIYSFQIPGKPAGAYVLSEVSVQVGDQRYRSIPRAFEIKKSEAAVEIEAETVRPVQRQPRSGIILNLENLVEGDFPLYPGQSARLGYRYTFNVSFDLTIEQLPLLQAEGFRKIGGKQMRESTEENLSVVDIIQEIEASKPGTYTFGPSVIEGYPYVTGVYGRKEYGKQKLRSEAPPVTVEVKPFPEEGKPLYFNGAVGEYTAFTTSLLPRPNIYVGDRLTMIVEITGNGNLHTVSLPPLRDQPGVRGIFRFSDLPSVGEVYQSQKRFVVELRPLTSSVEEIPSFAFAFFNPKTKEYEILQSEPIPIAVGSAGVRRARAAPPEEQRQEPPQWEAEIEPIEVIGNYVLTTADLRPLQFGTFWVLLLIPFGIGILVLQWQLQKYLRQGKKERKPKNAQQILEEALRQKNQPQVFFREVRRAILMRLYELGEISTPDLPPERLSQSEARSFLIRIERQRFTGEGAEIDESLIQEIRELFNSLEKKRSITPP